MKKTCSPVLDYDMIMSKKYLFSSLDSFDEAIKKYKRTTRNFCDTCRGSQKHEFAQTIRDELIERKMGHIFSQLEPRMIVRHGTKIYRASDFI